MRFLVDAQLPPSLAQFLRTLGEEATACREVGLRDADDGEIWRFAVAGGWCIVTKDEDFALRHMTETGGQRVVWRVAPLGTVRFSRVRRGVFGAHRA